jgi:DNA-binding NarL/FixJ family response regulator
MTDIAIINHRDTLARLMERDDLCIHIFDDTLAAFQTIEALKPAIIFIDYSMQSSRTAHVISYLSKANPGGHTILTAVTLNDDSVLDCLAAGAIGYLDLNDAEKFIDKLIKVVLDGEAWLSRRLVVKILQRLQNNCLETLNTD